MRLFWKPVLFVLGLALVTACGLVRDQSLDRRALVGQYALRPFEVSGSAEEDGLTRLNQARLVLIEDGSYLLQHKIDVQRSGTVVHTMQKTHHGRWEVQENTIRLLMSGGSTLGRLAEEAVQGFVLRTHADGRLVSIPSGDRIIYDKVLREEGYEVTRFAGGYTTVRVQVVAARQRMALLELAAPVDEPAFFVLETAQPQYAGSEKAPDGKPPAAVSYIHRVTQESFHSLVAKYYESLCNPGVVAFGYGAYSPFNQVLLKPAEGVIVVYASEPKRYEGILAELGIGEGAAVRKLIRSSETGPSSASDEDKLSALLDDLRKEGLEAARPR